MGNDYVLLIGPPGSGKTTQGSLLASALSAPHISMGEEIRRLRASGVRLQFDRGSGLLTPEATSTVLLAALQQGARTHVLDGIPRTPDQVPILVALGLRQATVIAYDISFPEAMARMRRRGREGEDPGVIASRHGDHARRAPGLLESCRSAGWHVTTIDASGSPDQVHMATLEAYNAARAAGG